MLFGGHNLTEKVISLADARILTGFFFDLLKKILEKKNKHGVEEM